MSFMHKKRVGALFRVVSALLFGGKLWLSALGRALPGEGSRKSAIKAVDRLLGNVALYMQRRSIYAVLAEHLLGMSRSAVILVDVTDARPGFLSVSASIAFDGRSLAIYSLIAAKDEIFRVKTQKRFLRDLQRILPDEFTPILVTDAGFESPWFNLVSELGWHYVGRVRNRTKFKVGDEWLDAQALHARATRRARNLGELPFPRARPVARRLVLAKRRRNKGRTRYTTKGKRGKETRDKRCSKSASEPWLLTPSLRCAAQNVVDIYALRMQCEETFRDTKNHRWGWALNQTRSKTPERIELLLMIAAIASVIQHAVGLAGETKKLHYRHQANTIRNRRVISLFVLGGLLLKSSDFAQLSANNLRQALAAIRLIIRDNSGLEGD